MGGGLDAKAGTIDALDTILAKLTGGSTIASISEEMAAAATGLQDKYAQYYIKVSDKFGKNEGYVEKELGRLEGLIKKGGLAQGKLDDLVSRSNILRKFRGEEVPIREEL